MRGCVISILPKNAKSKLYDTPSFTSVYYYFCFSQLLFLSKSLVVSVKIYTFATKNHTQTTKHEKDYL